MKRQLYLFLAVAASVFSHYPASAQTETRNYYVVIGAFAQIDNAVAWTSDANQSGLSAQYTLNQQRGTYYVYVMQTTEKRPAFAFALKLQAETKYKDAWVYVGNLGIKAQEPKVEPVQEPEPEPQPEPEKTETIIQEPTPVVEEEMPKVDSTIIEKPAEPVSRGKTFLFKLTNSQSGLEVPGEIHIQEAADSREYQAYKGNEPVNLDRPANADGTYLAVVQALGYRQERLLIDYNDPQSVASGKGPNNEFIVPISLTRSRRGDYIELNNVRFFQNSTIFTPQSQNELDGLVNLMNEEPEYEIRIHAHCNGEDARDITTLGDSEDLFNTSPENGRETASDKRLTELRARMVKRYLVENGIDEGRIKTKAEGGKVMLYPQTSTLANYNDRIEIEILKGK